ncbi:hypothetical protein JIR001_01120 [Polycladomyces abyssicola]|uniref:Uncharacterized protein n=1 Tax=Polycladomyces abyssicola TaxID=1125966 RepID=A0A8D5UC62_9BACL|nr:hypothetical protein [Polycladomyces abyssicola]BCU80329.1 hypothetical protein JIR001_01120 [Polycladomyces abyssicola]
MNKMMEAINKGFIKGYLAYKKAFSNRKGSQTVEYVFLVAGVIAIAALLKSVATDDLAEALRKKIEEFVKNS